MGRLFWKFFLTFWLALLVAGIGVGTAVWIRHMNWQGEETLNRAIDIRHTASLVAIAENVIRQGGVTELRGFFYAMQEAHLPPIYAVDDQNLDILRRELPPELLQLARTLFAHAAYPEAIRLVSVNEHQHYLLFVPLPKPVFNPHVPRHPPSPLLPILAGTLASLLFSAGLAWYFSKPIRTLRHAFAEIAGGSLETRVSALMGHRRDELSDLGRDFDHMADQIYMLVNAQHRLLHDVSHELRSPLARIHAAIGLGQQQPQKLPETLERIERESQRMSDLVGELLVLSRLEVGVPVSQRQEFDLAALIDDIVDDVRFEADQYAVKIHYQGINSHLVVGQAELLHRAIENVLRNALQHCRVAGEVNVVASYDEANQQLCLVIEDQGPGVPESDLAAIFEPFFRSGQNRKNNGIGLGLAIAYRSLEVHGGTIKASNRAEGGLRMQLNIPCGENDA